MVYVENERNDQTPRTCVLRVDNQAAVASLIKGSSSSDLDGALSRLFWNVEALGSTRRWVEYVNAKSNTADYPARQCAMPTETACRFPQGVSPREFRDAFTSWGALRREATLFTTKMERWLEKI